jgi:hypothetical protein
MENPSCVCWRKRVRILDAVACRSVQPHPLLAPRLKINTGLAGGAHLRVITRDQLLQKIHEFMR